MEADEVWGWLWEGQKGIRQQRTSGDGVKEEVRTSRCEEVGKSGSREIRKPGSQEVMKSGSQEVRMSGCHKDVRIQEDLLVLDPPGNSV